MQKIYLILALAGILIAGFIASGGANIPPSPTPIPIPPVCEMRVSNPDDLISAEEDFYDIIFSGVRVPCAPTGWRECENTKGGCRQRSCGINGQWSDWRNFGTGWSCIQVGGGESSDFRCSRTNGCSG